MPLYEYFCDKCQKEFTLLQSASVNKEETTCPECDSSALKHKFSTFASNAFRSSASQKPVTEDDLPNKDVLKLPLPKLRSEL